MELNHIQRVYFVGIGGIGMSAIARYFAKRGCVVCGYDKTRTNLTVALEQEGILVSYLDDAAVLPVCFLANNSDTLIVYTPAIPKNSEILNYFKDNGFILKKRSEVLGIISKGQFCIAVAGTHGKTTTSSIVAHVLIDSGYGCTAFLGGIASNYNSNFIIGNNNVVVVEADEYDRSFLTLHPDLAVITSMDADHLDIYGDAAHLHESFGLFAKQLKPQGTLFVRKGLPLTAGLSYSVGQDSQIKGQNIRVEGSKFVFDYVDTDLRISDIQLMLPGKHNVENAVAAIAVALKLGIDHHKIKAAIASFTGVKRRFEYIVNTPDHIYIDDYAHHPEELRACFDAVRQLYPDKKLTVIFQPHLFTRTRDFAAEFAKVLSTVDELLLLEIYPARELPLPGINSQFLLDKMSLKSKRICGKDLVIEEIKNTKPELLLTVGAGDIDTLIQPLKAILRDV
ncbi:UDP-N-acetylmuramate--L-alanine ligase [Pedobacter heparinus]|uniref:UDP-N-acetylmuramate--L-alanine ligase n=1 Tax=Pedobacter heparinus (strain ATCC 13125 / DSM 2366 / CIP 104194 / JCM 7457 / NBRC 12017 / NCIMB 9290 / NRRL B-14731 / HIM 762-3) TaxID=485917 RepID=C6Y476_PEDHD|nr:UDP-N-acetylmuramate--L-alanine ligase [Pedobacter heparinus]ACU05519.1 UDP-N-acetylmuramate/alanine ligase [Pedobacter heparinus DSM 2366]